MYILDDSSIDDVDTDEEDEELYMQDSLDELMFGDGPMGNYYPVDNELRYEDHFLNDRESGAGPNVGDYSIELLLDMGFSEKEIADALRVRANLLDGGPDGI